MSFEKILRVTQLITTRVANGCAHNPLLINKYAKKNVVNKAPFYFHKTSPFIEFKFL